MTSINISRQNKAGDCSLKCSYSYDYHNSSVIATNAGFSINLSYDKANIPPVIYNTNKYEVEGISIYSPSIHLFDENHTDAEIIISHKPLVSGPTLVVAIPITISGDSTTSSRTLVQIINSISSNAHTQGQSTNINISDFNLNNFIPAKKPLYSYTDNSLINWIVFGKENAIGLNQNTLNTLKTIIKPYPGILPKGPDIFYNVSGPTKGLSGNNDQIYIDCQPVTSSEEEVDISTSKSAISYDLINPTTILIFQILIVCILFFIILFGLNYGYQYISNYDVSFPKFGNKS